MWGLGARGPRPSQPWGPPRASPGGTGTEIPPAPIVPQQERPEDTTRSPRTERDGDSPGPSVLLTPAEAGGAPVSLRFMPVLCLCPSNLGRQAIVAAPCHFWGGRHSLPFFFRFWGGGGGTGTRGGWRRLSDPLRFWGAGTGSILLLFGGGGGSLYSPPIFGARHCGHPASSRPFSVLLTTAGLGLLPVPLRVGRPVQPLKAVPATAPPLEEPQEREGDRKPFS